MEQQSTTFTFDYEPQNTQAGVGNVVNSWFQRGPVDLPWELKDFFGVDGYVAPPGDPAFQDPQTSMNFGNAYTNMPPVSNDGNLMSPQPGTGYTHWGSIDTPFAQQQRMNGLQSPHHSHNGHPGMGRGV